MTKKLKRNKRYLRKIIASASKSVKWRFCEMTLKGSNRIEKKFKPDIIIDGIHVNWLEMENICLKVEKIIMEEYQKPLFEEVDL